MCIYIYILLHSYFQYYIIQRDISSLAWPGWLLLFVLCACHVIIIIIAIIVCIIVIMSIILSL